MTPSASGSNPPWAQPRQSSSAAPPWAQGNGYGGHKEGPPGASSAPWSQSPAGNTSAPWQSAGNDAYAAYGPPGAAPSSADANYYSQYGYGYGGYDAYAGYYDQSQVNPPPPGPPGPPGEESWVRIKSTSRCRNKSIN